MEARMRNTLAPTTPIELFLDRTGLAFHEVRELHLLFGRWIDPLITVLPDPNQ